MGYTRTRRPYRPLRRISGKVVKKGGLVKKVSVFQKKTLSKPEKKLNKIEKLIQPKLIIFIAEFH